MNIVEKILMCIDYCKEQNINSNGEILQELTEEDFDEIYNVIRTILED